MGVATSTALLMAAVAASGAVAAKSAHDEGQAMSRASSQEAEMARQKGVQETALAYDRARSERASADAFQSDLIAKASAFGGGTADRSVLDMMIDADARGEYNAMTQIFEGQARQRDLNIQASMAEFQGRSARRAGNMKAFSTILDTATTMGNMYVNAPKTSETSQAKSK